MTVVILRPYEDGKTNQWTDFGGTGTTAWDHLNKTTAYEGGAGKPSTTVGIKTKTASRIASVKCRLNGTEAFVLPAGATIQKIVLYGYLKSGTATAAKAFTFSAKGALSQLGENSLIATITNTAFGWTRLEATTGSTGMAKAKEELEKGNIASIELQSKETAPAEHEAVEVFLEIEYESSSSMTREATESVAVAEATTTLLSNPRSPAETIQAAEATTRVVAQPRSASESATIVEAAAGPVAHPRSATDSAAVVESTSRIVSQPRTPAEAVGVAEATTRVVSQARSASDTASIAESTQVGRGKSVSATESITIAEAASRTVSSVRAIAESLHLVEVATRVLHQARSAATTITISEAWTVEGNVQRKVRFFSRWAASALLPGRFAPPHVPPARLAAQAQAQVDQEVVRP